MFLDIWDKREHISELSGRKLDEFYGRPQWHSIFAHILNKGQYPKFRLNQENIIMLHPSEHFLLDQGTQEQREKYAAEWLCDWSIVYDKKEQLKQEYGT